VDREGQILSEEIQALRELLPVMQSDLEQQGDEGARYARAIEDCLTPVQPSAQYPSLLVLAEQCSVLREAFEAALVLLIDAAAHRAHEPAYQRLRERIRAHISAQIEREAPLVELAFHGFGARR
jgi:hypothetical protein